MRGNATTFHQTVDKTFFRRLPKDWFPVLFANPLGGKILVIKARIWNWIVFLGLSKNSISFLGGRMDWEDILVTYCAFNKRNRVQIPADLNGLFKRFAKRVPTDKPGSPEEACAEATFAAFLEDARPKERSPNPRFVEELLRRNGFAAGTPRPAARLSHGENGKCRPCL